MVEGWDVDDRHVLDLARDPAFDFHHRSIADPVVLAPAVEAADVVINLVGLCRPAAYIAEPLAVMQTNLLDVIPVIDACAASGTWLVHFSTSEVYGRTLSSHLPELADPPERLYVLRESDSPLVLGPTTASRWSYGAAKQVVERLIHAHHLATGLPFTILRPFNVVGPGLDLGAEDDGPIRVLSAFVNALAADRPIDLVDGGSARRCLTSIHDAIDLVVALLDQPDRAHGAIVNVGNPANEITMADLARQVAAEFAELSGDPAYRSHPVRSVAGVEFYGPGYEDSDRRVPDIARAQELVGWNPTRSIDQIVHEAVAAALVGTTLAAAEATPSGADAPM